MGFIYLMYNKITTKIYIGQTTERIEDRIRKHFSNEHNDELLLDYNRYGREAFEIYQLTECNNDELNEKEKYYIQLYDSFNNGYNLTPGGGARTFIYDEEKVIRLYKQGESLNSIQEKTGYRWSKIRLIIDTNLTEEIEKLHYDNIKNKHTNKKISLAMIDITGKNIQEIFESKLDAYLYICNEQEKEIDKQNFYTRVTIACKSDRICYKHRWIFGDDAEKIQETMQKKINNTVDTLIQIDMNNKRKSNKPSRKVLESLINKYTYEKVGEQYGVSGKTVRNWCDSYNISRITSKKPSKDELEELINSYKIREIADMFNVSAGTVSWWLKDLGVTNPNSNKSNKLKCVETNVEVNSYKEAGAYMKTLYPYTMDDKYVGFEIKKAIDSKTKLHGFTWIRL